MYAFKQKTDIRNKPAGSIVGLAGTLIKTSGSRMPRDGYVPKHMKDRRGGTAPRHKKDR